MAMQAGSFVWIELMTSDSKAAQNFYREVVGWNMVDAGMTPPYTLLMSGPAMVGGVMDLPAELATAGTPPCWTGYIGVDDVDAMAKRIQTAGGSVCRPPDDIPGVGRFAVVADPHGAVFIIFRGSGEPPAATPAPEASGSVGWHELHAGDGAKAFEFYACLFGWTKTAAIDMGPMGVYQTFATNGTAAAGGMMTKMPDSPVPFWLYYFNVDAIDAATSRVTGAGGKVLMGPHQVPTGQWIVQCQDPQGAMFALLSNQR
jgi:predicted enzyme related to lactoylglutathione lyase